ncbi:hypothetical protein GN956_G21521 [Arapaima gigas]
MKYCNIPRHTRRDNKQEGGIRWGKMTRFHGDRCGNRRREERRNNPLIDRTDVRIRTRLAAMETFAK